MNAVGFGSLRHPYLKNLGEALDASELDKNALLDLYTLQFVLDTVDSTRSGQTFSKPLIKLLLAGIRASKQGKSYLDLVTDLDHDLAAYDEILDELCRTGMASRPDLEGVEECPFVLNGNRLYLQRIWRVQQQIDQWVDLRRQRSQDILKQFREMRANAQDFELFKNAFKCLFNSLDKNASADSKIDWQAMAVLQAMTQSYLVLSGGPGTGKTTTATRMLLCLLIQSALVRKIDKTSSGSQSRDALRIRLLAPTGKAAVKLHQSISQRFPSLIQDLEKVLGDESSALGISNELVLPKEGETLHRALGVRSGGLGSTTDKRSQSLDLRKYNPDRHEGKLDADILLIDEASMIDLVLMKRLLASIPDHCRVIFMGDHDQLPPVETGEVLYEWVNAEQSEAYSESQLDCFEGLLPGMLSRKVLGELRSTSLSSSSQRHLCQLQHTYRFTGPIYEFAQLLKSDAESDMAYFNALFSHSHAPLYKTEQADLFSAPALSWLDLSAFDSAHAENLGTYLVEMLRAYETYFDLLTQNRFQGSSISTSQIETLFEAKSEFQILGAMYEGRLGINEINDLVESQFKEVISRNRIEAGKPSDNLYHGKVIMVTRNQPDLNIFNGDLGIVINRADYAYVALQDKAALDLDRDASMLELPIHLVEHWQTAYAMTVHKSQGSEYQKVAVVLPDSAKVLVNRRMLYTAITRSQKEVEFWATRNLVEACLV